MIISTNGTFKINYSDLLTRISTNAPEFLIVLVSGGRSSAMMARHIQTSEKYDKYEKLYCFCNTGQERPETIQFLKDMVYYWGIPLNIIEGVYSMEMGVGVRHRIVDFDTMDMEGKVFTEAIKHLNKNKWTGVPNAAIPYCSEYLKTRVSHSFAREIFGTTKYIKALGYRAEDVPKRIHPKELEEEEKQGNTYRIAPLLTDFEIPIGIPQLNEFFDNEPFKLSISSRLGNCELCYKKSEPNLIEAIQYGTRFIEWHKEQEEIYGNRFFRNNRSISELVALAESGTQMDLFSDVEDGCVCSFKSYDNE